MKIGDLVTYVDDTNCDPGQQGIIVRGPWDTFKGNNPTRRYEIVWYSCGNRGWWEEKNLELLSENR